MRTVLAIVTWLTRTCSARRCVVATHALDVEVQGEGHPLELLIDERQQILRKILCVEAEPNRFVDGAIGNRRKEGQSTIEDLERAADGVRDDCKFFHHLA